MNNQSLPSHMLIHYILAAFSFAVTYFWLNSFSWAALALAVSIFLDVDHVLDFWLGSGFSLNPIKFIKETLNGSPYFERSGKTLVLFHSWELLTLIVFISVILNLPRLGISFVLGFVPHLLWDQKTYAKRPLMYSFIFRALNKFDLKKICATKRNSDT